MPGRGVLPMSSQSELVAGPSTSKSSGTSCAGPVQRPLRLLAGSDSPHRGASAGDVRVGRSWTGGGERLLHKANPTRRGSGLSRGRRARFGNCALGGSCWLRENCEMSGVWSGRMGGAEGFGLSSGEHAGGEGAGLGRRGQDVKLCGVGREGWYYFCFITV